MALTPLILKQQIGFVERQLASDTYSGKAGVYLPNALAVLRFGIHLLRSY